MSRKLARLGDFHGCPVHVGGPVMGTAPSVLAERLPAARLADAAACPGPIDVISSGASMVLIRGLPAAGVTDRTLHGGEILTGAAQVLIGGPSFTVPANIVIEGDADFQNKVVRDLYFLSTTSTGASILERIGRSGQPITIVPSAGTNDNAGTLTGGSVIKYNPEGFVMYPNSRPPATVPPQVGLAHELVHGIHRAEGRAKDFVQTDPVTKKPVGNSKGEYVDKIDPLAPATDNTLSEKEAAAIGTGSHAREQPTENGLLRDLDLPSRVDRHGEAAPPGFNPRPGWP